MSALTSVLVSLCVSPHLPDQLVGKAGRPNKLYTCTITLIWSGVRFGTNVQTEQVVYCSLCLSFHKISLQLSQVVKSVGDDDDSGMVRKVIITK